MALTPSLSTTAANAAADVVCTLANNGYLRIFSGTQAATADTAISTQVQLAELRFGATAFGAAVAGVATANAITSDPAADATGVAAWFRVYKADGTSALWDGSVGTTGANLNFASVNFVANARIDVTSFTYTQRAT